MSFLVIGIHTSSISLNSSFLGMDYIWELAVPMFFLISGFFLYKSYILGGLKKIDRYIVRIIRLYILYTVIYIPITLIGFNIDNNSVWKDVFIFIRNIIFVGENYYSWPLWYLLALIISVVILRVMLKYKFTPQRIFFSGFVLTCIGLGIQSMIDIPTDTFWDSLIKLYKLTFRTTRNGFFVGFGYISAGFLIAYYENILAKYVKMECLLLILAYVLYLYNVPLALNAVSFFLFCIVLQMKVYTGYNNIWLRNMSTLIYFFHMYFVFLLGEVFHVLNMKLSFIQSFVVISLLTIVFCSIVLYLSRKYSIFKKLLG